MVALSLKEVGASYGRKTVLSNVGVDALKSGSLTAIAGVNQQRLAGRRDKERRVSALDVDEIDVER